MKILVPVDGSEHSLHALQHALSLIDSLKVPPQLVLLNVQRSVAKGNVKLLIDAQTIDDYQREQGMTALKPARQILDTSGFAYQYHLSVGQPAEAIAQFAAEHGVSHIVIGARGEGGLGKRLLGSVVAQVLETSEVPVTVVH
ncbi:MAG: universal stress protein [Gammaproteobacteria bacterium]|nr:universal stress protein [Gammaproteobacteria bacterium]MBU1625493.1 universal stress protein [Gammaproteobacteria bacterium]MBU1980753.1 universal stress protein [Gammaproteobacteria bacterium]